MTFYYDATALSGNYAVNEQDFRWVIIHEFERRGWTVEDVYLGNPMRHDEKYLLINQGFAGKQRLMPFFNRLHIPGDIRSVIPVIPVHSMAQS